MVPLGVRTPSTPRGPIVEARRRRVREQHRAPSFSAARQYPIGSSDGSTLQSVGLQVTATMPRSPRIGSRRRASATLTSSMGTPTLAAPRSTSRGELLGVALGARDLERAALREAERLARLVGERRELRDRALGQPRQRRRRADLAGQPRRARRCLGGEREALQHRHAHAPQREMVRGARAEGAGADDDDVSGIDHRGPCSSGWHTWG